MASAKTTSRKKRNEDSCLVCSQKLSSPTTYTCKCNNGEIRHVCEDCHRVLILLRPANHKFSVAEIRALSHAVDPEA